MNNPPAPNQQQPQPPPHAGLPGSVPAKPAALHPNAPATGTYSSNGTAASVLPNTTSAAAAAAAVPSSSLSSRSSGGYAPVPAASTATTTTVPQQVNNALQQKQQQQPPLYGLPPMHATSTPGSYPVHAMNNPVGHATTSSTSGVPSSGMGVPPPMDPSAANANRPNLNVQDALSYLDKVKVQFAEQPEIYNKFLEIMKDFKSHWIDTPGVIDRVSTLFKGYPSLIMGFNTFLPAGYKIEVRTDPSGQSYTITTPDNVQRQHHAIVGAPMPPNSAVSAAPGYYGVSTQAESSTGMRQPIPPAAGHTLPPVMAPGAKKAPVEFNHAINYVNKIKNRYANDPETYKQFLEILRTYQNEARPIAEVYAQVQQLFRGTPDLLDEFKQFLPDPNVPPARPAYVPGPAAGPATPSGAYVPPPTMDARGPAEYVGYGPMRVPAAGKYKRPVSSVQQPNFKRVRYETARGVRSVANQYGAAEEFEFFERVKKALGNKTTYSEFLKILNLFNQDIIDPKILVERVEPFLAKSPELFEWFKSYVRADELMPGEIIRSSAPPKDLSNAKRSGSSYRLLPKDYIQPPCSGRDALCYEVLNDHWTCHPTWASEDGGFVAHKKNVYEEAMYRCEEERYEFDLCIDANKSVIQRLEPIAKKIAEMSPEEQRNFKLPANLGDGCSKSILHRAIKKIYDKERGLEVLDSLQEHPAVAVPIVLKRLKQKDEEWRRNQREWNKIWRELDAKNFYKSLDHQGINFKNTDKKNLSSKSLIVEIETLYREAHLKPSPIRPKFQYRFEMPDRTAMEDVKALIVSYLDKSAQYSGDEQQMVQQLLDSFLNIFFPNAGKAGTQDESMQVDGNPTVGNYTLFGSNTFFLFFRLFQLAYERMLKMRKICANITNVPVGYSKLGHQDVAEALDLTTKRENAPVDIVDGNLFGALMNLVDKLFDSEIDINVFEEQTRFWFGTDAFALFTIDKLIHNICKHFIMIATDPRTVKMYNLFLRMRKELASPATELLYRQKADEMLSEEENFYRIDYHASDDAITIELLGETEYLSDEVGNAEARWSDYIDNYVKSNWTGEQYQPRKPVFMKRNLPKQSPGRKKEKYSAVNNLECKICVNTYKMFFLENTEDVFMRHCTRSSLHGLRAAAHLAGGKFRRWLEGETTGWHQGLNSAEAQSARKLWEKLVKQ